MVDRYDVGSRMDRPLPWDDPEPLRSIVERPYEPWVTRAPSTAARWPPYMRGSSSAAGDRDGRASQRRSGLRAPRPKAGLAGARRGRRWQPVGQPPDRPGRFLKAGRAWLDTLECARPDAVPSYTDFEALVANLRP